MNAATAITLCLCLTGARALLAQSAETPPVGFVSKTVPAGADVTYAPAFHRSPAFIGEVATVVNATTLELAGEPGWTVDQFKQTHYLLVSSGPKEGLFAEISGNTASSLSLTFLIGNLGTEPGDAVVSGDQVKIIPYWTLGTLMPQDSVPNNTQVFLYNRSQSGVNKSASAIYTHFTGYGWYSGPTNGNNQILYPDESVVIRAPVGVSFTLTQSGSVPLDNVRTLLSNITAGQDQDIRVASTLPVGTPVGSLFAPGSAGNGDKLLIFDEASSGRNKSASMILTYYTGFGWYSGPSDMNSLQIQPGQGVVYRKAGANSAQNIVVNYAPPYNP